MEVAGHLREERPRADGYLPVALRYGEHSPGSCAALIEAATIEMRIAPHTLERAADPAEIKDVLLNGVSEPPP
jgi:hypothetical protein